MSSRLPLPQSSVLIATLGSEPQVVTVVLDLLQQKEAIQRVQVLHTVASKAPIAAAVETLSREFERLPNHGGTLFELYPLIDQQGNPLPDVETAQAAQAAFRVLYQLVYTAKKAGERVHLSIAGGRKTLAVFGMAVAQMLFDEDDRLWHLYSSGEFLASKRLHPASGDDVHLIEIPVIRWSHISPLLSALRDVDDPFEASRRISQMQVNERIEQGRSFVLGALTPAEGRVVALLVQDGLSDLEIAGRLNLSPRTVEQHLRSAYIKAANHWELADVGRAHLIMLLSIYYGTQNTGKPA